MKHGMEDWEKGALSASPRDSSETVRGRSDSGDGKSQMCFSGKK